MTLTILLQSQAGVQRFESPYLEGFGWSERTGELHFPGSASSDAAAQVFRLIL